LGKHLDLRGKTFGRLTCIEISGKDNQGRTKWLCECECGNKKEIVLSSLTGGKTKSCGCLHKEIRKKISTTHSLSVDENGKTPRLYGIWRNMKQRCNNPKASKYKIYGGRGIKVCDEWVNYMPFHEWAMSNGYSKELTLDRSDGEKGYSPFNCTWQTFSVQNLNKNNNHFITFLGERKTLHEWSQEIGMKYSTLKCRLDDYGWTIEKAFNTPVRMIKK